jgi:hypothetical protein
MLKTGAAGYLYKANALVQLIDAVRRVSDEGLSDSPITPSAAASLPEIPAHRL